MGVQSDYLDRFHIECSLHETLKCSYLYPFVDLWVDYKHRLPVTYNFEIGICGEF